MKSVRVFPEKRRCYTKALFNDKPVSRPAQPLRLYQTRQLLHIDRAGVETEFVLEFWKGLGTLIEANDGFADGNQSPASDRTK